MERGHAVTGGMTQVLLLVYPSIAQDWPAATTKDLIKMSSLHHLQVPHKEIIMKHSNSLLVNKTLGEVLKTVLKHVTAVSRVQVFIV